MGAVEMTGKMLGPYRVGEQLGRGGTDEAPQEVEIEGKPILLSPVRPCLRFCFPFRQPL